MLSNVYQDGLQEKGGHSWFWLTISRYELFFGQKPGVLQCPDSKYDWFDYFNRFLLVFI
jgi:hypothetical protein